jgi:CBS domain-containing protein
MEFSVRDWMIDLIVYIDPDSSVNDALALMRRRYISSLIVKSNDATQIGILTSTDICDKIVAQGRNPSKVKVSEIMTRPLIVVKWSAPLKECAALMKEKNIHHIPVVDDNGDLRGMISATDFLVAAEAMGRAPGEKII